MTLFQGQLQTPYEGYVQFAKVSVVSTALEPELVIPDDGRLWIIEGIDMCAQSGTPGPALFTAQSGGVFFWCDSQDIGAGLQVYASYRGSILVSGTLALAINSSFSSTLSINAWGRVVAMVPALLVSG